MTRRQSERSCAGAESPTLMSARRPQQRVTASLLSDLVAGYEAGQTTYQLARKHGLNRNTIAAHLRSAGVTIRMESMTLQQIDQAVEYYRAGWSLAKIGRAVGADAETVRKRLHEYGVTMRSRESAGSRGTVSSQQNWVPQYSSMSADAE
jgi:hypothetical protein